MNPVKKLESAVKKAMAKVKHHAKKGMKHKGMLRGHRK